MRVQLHHSLLWALLMPNAAFASAVDLGLIEKRDADPIPSPVSVSPSQFFDGIDGPWSTFELRVGSPAQNLRILPGTSSTQTLVVLPEGCQIIKVADCANSRGNLFNKTASKTWNEIGLFNLGFENALGFKDNGDYGYDTVGLGYLGSGGPVVNHSIIAGVAGTEFYLGVLALNPRPTNFTDQNDPQQSFLQLLKNESAIPSLSYSYNAGAPYRLNKALGSLILGGYDTSAYQDTNSSYDFFSDQSRDLTIGVQSISTNASADNTVLQSSQISMFIDSSIAEIYLPLDACRAFEKAFGLTYNSTLEMYLVSDSLHSKLTEENPYVTFTITTAITGGSTFNITFPYASFDLQAKPPLVKTASRYFPLKRAANDTQYVLGRTFLQEAYLIVDYERGNFSVHPRVWNASAESNLVTILPLGAKASTPNTESHSLSGGAIAGIVIGVCVAIVAVAVAILRFLVLPRRKKAAAKTPLAEAAAMMVPETTEVVSPEPPRSAPAGTGGSLRELEGDETTKPTPEIEGTTPAKSPMSELETPHTPQVAELAGPVPLAELLSNEIYEMPGSDVPELQGSRVAPVLVLTDSDSSEFSFEVEPGVIGVIQQTEDDRQHNTGEDVEQQDVTQEESEVRNIEESSTVRHTAEPQGEEESERNREQETGRDEEDVHRT
ncbi:acid protease [Trichoderma arundinaceum]|uniref:Acid protease n=1 Tax=Trichoderma arundinaceum TaxID=490622 RepID=A0A395NQM7_TRIAR|nr:acid protease [Trichoderma arundinaceum]